MDKTSLQMLFGVLLGVFLLALIVMTVVYVRRKLADKREEALRDLDLMHHYFDNIDECIHDLIVEMYDCGFVRTEEIFVAAYGEEALTPDSFIYMTDADCDLEKAKAALPPVSEKNQKIIYDLWCSYVEKLLDTVEIHTTDANKDIIKDALMVYGRKKITILLRSPE